MADFGVIVGLEVTASAEEIRKKLPNLQNELNNDENARLKLIAGLDIAKTKKLIQAQLATIVNSGKDIPKINLGVNVSTNNSVKNAVGQINEGIQKAAQATDLSKTIFNAEKLNKEGRMYVSKVTDVLETVKNRFLRQGAKDVQFLELKNANGQLKSFIATVDYGSGILKKFNFEKAKIDTGGKKANNGFVQTDFMSVSDKSMASYQKTLNFLNTIDKRVADINSKTLLQNKPLQEGTVFYDNYINKLNSVLATINQVRNSNTSLTDEEKRNIGLIVNELKNLAKEQQTAAYPPTKLASTSIGDSVRKYSAELAALEQKWKVQGILVGDFKVKVDQLKTSLSGVGTDKTALDSFRTQLSVTRQEASLLQKSMMETRGIDNLNTKIAVLTNQIVAYKNANGKAMQSNKLSSNQMTFSAELDSLLTKLGQARDDTSYRKIANQFRVIKSEIKSMGLEGGTFIQSLWANMKKFASWMGMTTIMSRFGMEVRQAVTELKDLDTILTEISKTSDRTDESLRKLGNTSFNTASKYGRTASDYLTSIQEMSRAGFEEGKSDEMAELSVLAQSAGDMTAELANEYLIATNAGYKLAGDTEKLNSVLDSQNYITNRNALSMSELAEATKIVASQASQSDVGIDKMTAAVGTMIATTQQGGEIAARSFKGILMNLQQVKAEADEIGDGGEAITTESLSKYEKACEDLGVALKEVKNGVWTLRDPMKILEELSQAVAKESGDSIKVANLINAVGGKYRGNQLSALLRNWDTYKKMLSEFNSDEAVGSAFEEAMKSANNWQGELNKLSNTWTNLVENFVNSDLAKEFLRVTNTVVGGLESVTELLGGFPTLVGAFAASLSFKNVGELLNTPPYAPLQLCA